MYEHNELSKEEKRMNVMNGKKDDDEKKMKANERMQG